MGGVTGMQFAVSHPERLRKLVLVAPAPSGGLSSDPELRQQMKAMRGNRDAMRQFWQVMMVRPENGVYSDALIDLAIDDDLKWSETAYDGAWQAMAELRLAEAITHLQVPTLMVVGDRDFLREANLEDAARIPDCALQVFYRAGHLIPFDVPDAFVTLLDDFLQHGAAPASTLLTNTGEALATRA
jgi:pimeloyl-ACP methyl ester carboxylesterase